MKTPQVPAPWSPHGASTETIECSVCHEPAEYLERYYDRHNIYSGRACSDKCARSLPGQGAMWNYEAEEPIEEES